MAQESITHSGDADLVPIVVDGLRKSSRTKGGNRYGMRTEISHKERILLPEHVPISALWAKLKSLNYDAPDWLQYGEKGRIDIDEDKICIHPYEEIEVVQGRPSENGKCINVDDPLIAFTNRYFKNEIKLNIAKSNSNDDSTAMESLKYDSGLEISFHRTIRMPDDDKLHQLPASLGSFPLYNVSSYADQLPDNIVRQGGVFLPMWQREAMWMSFNAPYQQNYALRVFIGRINAVSGLRMDESVEKAPGLESLQDYVVVPGQEWLDGICVAPGIVRQFVAMPLGSGYTVEGQKTGEEKFGGLQIEIIPSYERRLRTWQPDPTRQGRITGLFDESKSLDEDKTPSELNLNPGVKIRCYPARPTYSSPYQISDLTGTAPKEDTHVKAFYRNLELSEDIRPALWYNIVPHTSQERVKQGYPANPDYATHSTPSPAYQSPLAAGYSYPPVATPPPPPAGYSYPPVAAPPSTGGSYGRPPTSANTYGKPPISITGPNVPTVTKDESKVKLVTKDLKALGLAAGGKLVQDIYRDPNPARTWNTESAQLVNVHILDPASCEKVTHIVPPPPPIDAMGYVEAEMPFFVVEEQVDNRVDGGDFDNVISVSAKDKEKGVTTEPAFDPSKPKMCKECETRLCDCIVRPCDHQFCNVCIRKLEDGHGASSEHVKQWKCPTCSSDVSHVAGFSAPMNLPGEEALKVRVPVHVLKIEDGRVRFKSINKTRI